jgi:hypothetical protein
MSDWLSVVRDAPRRSRVRLSSKAVPEVQVDKLIEDIGRVSRAVARRADAEFDAPKDLDWKRRNLGGWREKVPIAHFLKDGDGPLRALSAQELAFVTAYVESMNFKDAAQKAGYGKEAVGRLRNSRPIGRAIVYMLERRARESAVTQDVVLKGLLTEARGAFTRRDGSTDSTPSSRVAAWRALGEYLQMFVAKVDIELNGKVKVISSEVLDAESWVEIHGHPTIRPQEAIEAEIEE